MENEIQVPVDDFEEKPFNNEGAFRQQEYGRTKRTEG